MNTKKNWKEIAGKIDFTALNAKLLAAANKGELLHKQSALHLLDKVKESVIRARATGASYSAVAEFLKDHGLPVSEATLREYLRNLESSDKPRKKVSQKKKLDAEATEQPKATEPTASAQNLPPAAGTQTPESASQTRGPRIADPRRF